MLLQLNTITTTYMTCKAFTAHSHLSCSLHSIPLFLPDGPAQELIEKPVLETIARALRPGGVLCSMAERMRLHTHLIDDLISVCRDTFKGSVRYAWPTVPTCPSGVIGFLLCSKEGSPVDFLNPFEKVKELSIIKEASGSIIRS